MKKTAIFVSVIALAFAFTLSTASAQKAPSKKAETKKEAAATKTDCTDKPAAKKADCATPCSSEKAKSCCSGKTAAKPVPAPESK